MTTTTPSSRATVTAIGLVLVLALFTSCSRKSSGTLGLESPSAAGAASGGWALHVMNQPGHVFRVEYSDKTVVIDRQTVSHSLRGFSEDHTIFLFNDSPSLRQKLAPGKFVL